MDDGIAPHWADDVPLWALVVGLMALMVVRKNSK